MPVSEPSGSVAAADPESRRRGRVAVVIVHGIGEQHPTTTLRAFADAVVDRGDPARPRYYIKPDVTSELLDLRRVVARSDGASPTTYFYEIYWAHLIRDTRLGHILAWLRHVLLRRPCHIPPRIRAVYWVAWALVVVAVTAGVLGVLLDVPVGLKFVLYGVAPVVSYFIVQWLGDAARYLIPSPDNIAARQAIRLEGLRLLRELHRGDRYDRILVVAHSLGSVIAYDLLACYWAECHKRHGRPATVSQEVLDGFNARAAEHLPPKHEGEARDGFRGLQRALLAEQLRHGFTWKISDFVTLGSPLCHAELLMAASPALLERGRSELSMPTCPPRLDEDSMVYVPPRYQDSDRAATPDIKLMHHAALFACTTWRNYYFHNDLVGGPLAPVFGQGIEERPLRYVGPRAWLRGRVPFLSHTHYWTDARENECTPLLRAAIVGEPRERPKAAASPT